IMGMVLRGSNPPLLKMTAISLPLVLLCIYLGSIFPLNIQPLFGTNLRTTWDILLLGYCFFAAVIPVWLLLQPRGYLGGTFLVFTAGISFIGLVVGTFTQNYVIQYPAFVKWVNPQGLPLLPLLFTTVACGACSGFHALVSSGTTSKQISNEKDAKPIGYGGMLLESFVAVIALGTLLLLSKDQMIALRTPDQIYANGIASFLNSLGINRDFAFNFALLAFATFVYDTLDVATRLGRYIFQELTHVRGKISIYVSALATLLLPLFFVTREMKDAQGNIIPVWQLFWTVFGASNQLLAALVLLGLSVWLFKKKGNFMVTLIPSVFMIIVAMVSLWLLLKPWVMKILSGGTFAFEPLVLTIIALFILAAFLIIEGAAILIKGKASHAASRK
ncbi:MAG: carbon starvation CstA family protein, partial [Candidatus Omnitrophica bacterium]|nr:carbon starvation CstA family protein [Candidatus Omnitrophota bacterium]